MVHVLQLIVKTLLTLLLSWLYKGVECIDSWHVIDGKFIRLDKFLYFIRLLDEVMLLDERLEMFFCILLPTWCRLIVALYLKCR